MVRIVSMEKSRRRRVMWSGSLADHGMCCEQEMTVAAKVQSYIRSLFLAVGRCNTVEVMRPYWHVTCVATSVDKVPLGRLMTMSTPASKRLTC